MTAERVVSPARLILAVVIVGAWVRWLAASPWVATATAVGLLALVLVVVASIPGTTIHLGSLVTAPARPLSDDERSERPAASRRPVQRGGFLGSEGVRVLLAIVGGFAVVLLLGWLALVQMFGGFTGPPNAEATRREQLLLALPMRDMRAVGLTLTDEWSSPGEEASGFAADSPNPVTVRRTYQFTGDPLKACEGVSSQLIAAGWVPDDFRYPCSPLGKYGNTSLASLAYQCEAFRVSADISARHEGGDPPVVEVMFETPYPDVERPGPYDNPPSGHRGTTTSTIEPPGCSSGDAEVDG